MKEEKAGENSLGSAKLRPYSGLLEAAKIGFCEFSWREALVFTWQTGLMLCSHRKGGRDMKFARPCPWGLRSSPLIVVSLGINGIAHFSGSLVSHRIELDETAWKNNIYCACNVLLNHFFQTYKSMWSSLKTVCMPSLELYIQTIFESL